MNAISLLVKSVALFTFLLAAASAQAGYRCDAPATSLDRRACAAAQEGPQALRRYIQRVRVIESLEFADYVNEATLLAWEARERAQQASRSADKAVATGRR